MQRRARIAVTGIPWHIIQRGDNRSAVSCMLFKRRYGKT